MKNCFLGMLVLFLLCPSVPAQQKKKPRTPAVTLEVPSGLLTGEATLRVSSTTAQIKIGLAETGVSLIEFPVSDRLYLVHPGVGVGMVGGSDVQVSPQDVLVVDSSRRGPHDPLVLRPGPAFSVKGPAKCRALVTVQMVSGLIVTIQVFAVEDVARNANRVVVSYDTAEIIQSRSKAGLATVLTEQREPFTPGSADRGAVQVASTDGRSVRTGSDVASTATEPKIEPPVVPASTSPGPSGQPVEARKETVSPTAISNPEVKSPNLPNQSSTGSAGVKVVPRPEQVGGTFPIGPPPLPRPEPAVVTVRPAASTTKPASRSATTAPETAAAGRPGSPAPAETLTLAPFSKDESYTQFLTVVDPRAKEVVESLLEQMLKLALDKKTAPFKFTVPEQGIALSHRETVFLNAKDGSLEKRIMVVLVAARNQSKTPLQLMSPPLVRIETGDPLKPVNFESVPIFQMKDSGEAVLRPGETKWFALAIPLRPQGVNQRVVLTVAQAAAADVPARILLFGFERR